MQKACGLVELEALALAVHREAGFDVPRCWQVEFNGVPALAVERFDRDSNRNPLFTETLYSVLASGDSRITHNHSYSFDRIGRAIRVANDSSMHDGSACLLRLSVGGATGSIVLGM